MDLTVAGVSAYQLAQTQGQAQISVDAKVLNIARQEGQDALQLLQSASGGGDALAAKATGLGGQLDVLG